MLLSIMLCPSFPPLLMDVPLAPAVAFDPITERGEAKDGKEGGDASSFLRDKRHRFFFSFSLGVSGMGISAGAASSSTWSMSDPSLKELCSDVGGDFLDFNGWALLGWRVSAWTWPACRASVWLLPVVVLLGW
jgi:hypothetical protein